jgi:hypothetical protein
MLLCIISPELAGCVHQPIVGSGQTNLSHLYFSRLSLAMRAKLIFFKTPISVRLVQVGSCPLPLEYQAATSHTDRQPCRAKSLYMKRFWGGHTRWVERGVGGQKKTPDTALYSTYVSTLCTEVKMKCRGA